jgi:hypothetical protein
MSHHIDYICAEILGQLRYSGEPLSLEDMFEDMAPIHLKAIRHLTQVEESVETVYLPNTPIKYQLR